ncbi:MAG: hypothetical protein NTX49_06515 [Chlamydiae bacterium]|nr:hypothetical protein [Chlamydiota bacterium]
MMPSMPRARPSGVPREEEVPFVNLQLGIPGGYSFSDRISENGFRSVDSQIARIVNRVIEDPQLERRVSDVRSRIIFSRGYTEFSLRRIRTGFAEALARLPMAMEDDDPFRPTTPLSASMSDPGTRSECIVNGLLVTPPKPFSTRPRAAMIDECPYELSRAALDRPALRSLAQPRVTHQPLFPPRDFSLHAGSEVTPPAQLPRAVAMPPVVVPASPDVRLPLFDDDY